jgi:transcriptional regulator of heat shock response
MTSRSTQILEAAIESFIQTGEPVSSGRLYDEYDFGIKPAMIRLELDALEDAGYLGQPHHSAGRVPTDAGYEFFARRVLEGEGQGERVGVGDSLSPTADRAFRGATALPDFLEQLSAQLGILSIAADLARDMVYKAGLEALVSNLDWQDRDEIRSVIRDFEEVDERLAGASKKLNGSPQVFIGKKSPVTRSETLSVVGEFCTMGGAQISIFAIGPKRMDYRKVIRIFRSL